MAEEERRAIEAILMVSEEPIETPLLAQLLELPQERVEAMCAQLAAAYDAEDRGFVLVRVAGGWRFQSHPDLAPYVERFALEGQSARLSSAALETLAIVAYKQPVSRAQVASIRGVDVDAVMRTLQRRGYIEEVARDPGPGLAVLFGTTPLFLEKPSLDHVDQLPPRGDFVPAPETVEALEQGVLPVGRLDAVTEGLLLLTNDGELAHRLTHPSYGVEKEYLAEVADVPSPQALRRLRQGVDLEDGRTAPARVGRVGDRGLRITIHEGRKRQVRRMCEAVGHPVLRLVRTRMGPLAERDLAPGKWRALDTAEVRALERATRKPERAEEGGAPTAPPAKGRRGPSR